MAQVEYGICTRPSLRVLVMQYIRYCGVEGVACETTLALEVQFWAWKLSVSNGWFTPVVSFGGGGGQV